jgi:DNA polymerase
MSDQAPFTPEELARQVRQHLQSLREAGLEWLPRRATPDIHPVTESSPIAPATAPVSGEAILAQHADLFAPEAPPDIPPEQRRRELELIAEEVSQCTRCPELLATRNKTVFGVGPVDPELCFVGEGPGGEEDIQGLPFVGPAGQLLNKIIHACGFQREEVYICNIVKCRPPGNRLPLVSEAANCRGFLERQLELVRPKFICALGACAAQNLLGTTQSIGRLRRHFYEYNGIPVLCTYHPAYLLRSPDQKKHVWEDMKMLLARMGRPIPAGRGGG